MLNRRSKETSEGRKSQKGEKMKFKFEKEIKVKRAKLKSTTYIVTISRF